MVMVRVRPLKVFVAWLNCSMPNNGTEGIPNNEKSE